jgi:hypothetical protein
MAESTLLSDEEQWLDGRTLALERDINGLRASTADLEAALEGKAGGQRRVTCRRVRVVAAAAPDGRDCAALRREQLVSDRVKARQNRVLNSAGSRERGQVWTYRPARNGGKLPKRHSDQRRSLPGLAAL